MKLFRKCSRANRCQPFLVLVLAVCASRISPAWTQSWGTPQQQPGGGQYPPQQQPPQIPLQQPGMPPQQQPGGQYNPPQQQPGGQYPSSQQPGGQYLPPQQPGAQYPPPQQPGIPPQGSNPQDGYYIIPQGGPQVYPTMGPPTMSPTPTPPTGTGGKNFDDYQTECTAQSRLIGSINAQWNDAPYMASLRDLKSDRHHNYGLGHFCGGIIIHPYMVLTAASCIVNRLESDIGVVVGTLNRRKQATWSQLLFVQKMVSHPSYTFQAGGHDIGLLLLRTAVFLGSKVAIAPLAYKDPRSETDCTLYGWGETTAQGQLISDCLRKATVKVQNLEECKQRFLAINIKLPPSVFCAGHFGGGPDACQGDIGGPAVCEGNVHGVIGNKVGCGAQSAGKIYTNVYSFRTWIDYTMNSLKQEFKNLYPEGALNSMRSGAVLRDDAPAAAETPATAGVAAKCASVGLALATGLTLLLA
ncbi:hypothetical protein RP20_CCG026683 [Aedes albopictus]|nr:hypothetical protein RP20_CCG026683 [Aedes albopictus]